MRSNSNAPEFLTRDSMMPFVGKRTYIYLYTHYDIMNIKCMANLAHEQDIRTLTWFSPDLVKIKICK
jgi:hypothetical protein